MPLLSLAWLVSLAALAQGKDYFPGSTEYLAAIAVGGSSCPTRCPDKVILPYSVEDVVDAVRAARQANSSVAVRCGGHSMWCQWARGSGTLIDLRPLRNVSVEKGASGTVVRVGGGATFYEILPFLHKHNVEVLHGMVKNLGLGGITLAGGYHVELTPQNGWAVDNILGFTLVTPSGSLVHVNETGTRIISLSPYEPDATILAAKNWLWWAVKGSWSSFGTVVEFELVGHPHPAKTMDWMVVNAFLNITGALKVVSRPPPGWSCSLLSAPASLSGIVPGIHSLVKDATEPGVAAPGVRTEGLMGCVKLHDDAEPNTMPKLMKQYGVHTLTGIDIPVPIKLFEVFQPCEGRHGGFEGFGLLIGTERNLTAAQEIMKEVVSASWAPFGELWGVILGGGGRFELRSETAMDWPKNPIFVALAGGQADTLINWVNKKLPEWQQSVDARIMPNWGDCRVKDFGAAYWGRNHEKLLAYRKVVDPTNVMSGIQLVGQGDTKCWSDDDQSHSANCLKAGATQHNFSQVWKTAVTDCNKRIPPYQNDEASLATMTASFMNPFTRNQLRDSPLNSTYAAAPPHGPFDTQSDSFHVGGLVARGSQSASIWYPVGTAPVGGFPVVTFAHGAPVGGNLMLPATYGPLLTALASWGFVVVAPESCIPPTGWSCLQTLYKDQLHVVAAAKANRTIHSGFASANFSRIGVIGHSYGADATVTSAGIDGFGITAAVVLHPAHDANAAQVKVPTMVVTGSRDLICPPGDAEFVYDRIPTRPKYLLELEGATHMEPTRVPFWWTGVDGRNRMSPSFTMFLACHLAAWNEKEGCEFVSGTTGRAVCNQNITFTKCEVENVHDSFV